MYLFMFIDYDEEQHYCILAIDTFNQIKSLECRRPTQTANRYLNNIYNKAAEREGTCMDVYGGVNPLRSKLQEIGITPVLRGANFLKRLGDKS